MALPSPWKSIFNKDSFNTVMKNIYSPETLSEITSRMNKLTSSSTRQWGKMNVAQMLAHCSAALEAATGQKCPPRTTIGKILGPLFKGTYLGEKPLGKNSPTDKSFIISDDRNFNFEHERLRKLITLFSTGGEDNCTKHPHSFFGHLTPAEWGIAQYKHLDHHLRQFGA